MENGHYEYSGNAYTHNIVYTDVQNLVDQVDQQVHQVVLADL